MTKYNLFEDSIPPEHKEQFKKDCEVTRKELEEENPDFYVDFDTAPLEPHKISVSYHKANLALQLYDIVKYKVKFCGVHCLCRCKKIKPGAYCELFEKKLEFTDNIDFNLLRCKQCIDIFGE